MLHILYHDKASGRVIAHMEVAEDLCNVKKIQTEHDKPGNPLRAVILQAKSFKLPKGDGVPEDLFISDIDIETGKIRGKHAADP